MSLKNKSVLIVDNDDSTLRMLDLFFTSTGAKVLLEGNVKDASRLLDQIRPDMIILNLNEIDMDDSEYCKQIKENFSKVATPIIVTSTISVQQFEERASDLRAIHYLQKPYSSLDLVNAAREILEISMTASHVRPFHLRAE